MKRRRKESSWVPALREEYLSVRASKGSAAAAKLITNFAKLHGMNRSTVFRELKLKLCTRKKADEVVSNERYIDAFGLDVFNFARARSTENARFSWTNAYEILIGKGLIPATVTLDEIYVSIRRQRLKTKSRSVPKQWEREHPMSLVQIDYSVSRHCKNAGRGLVILKGEGDGYYKGAGEKDRVWFGMIVDDASRVCYAEYILSEGESVEMVHNFLISAFGRKEIVNEETGEYYGDRLFQGIPKAVYWDRSSTHRSELTEEVLTNMGVLAITGNQEIDSQGNVTNRSNKKAHGKVERRNGIIKQKFEQVLYGIHGRNKQLTLEELNELLWAWLREYNSNYHDTREGKRWEIFEPALAECRFAEPNDIAVYATGFKRVVRQGLINVGRRKFALAPEWAPERMRVVIVPDHGSYYAIDPQGRRELLAMQNEELQDVRAERDDDVLRETALRERLENELAKVSDDLLSIRGVRETHGDDLAEFFERARTVGEVRLLAQRIFLELQAKPAANIIQAREI